MQFAIGAPGMGTTYIDTATLQICIKKFFAGRVCWFGKISFNREYHLAQPILFVRVRILEGVDSKALKGVFP